MISCQLHDYIEIACMYRYPVRLLLRSDEVVEGIAIDTQLNEDREECIKLKIGEEDTLVALINVSRMEAVKPNPHFDVVKFN